MLKIINGKQLKKLLDTGVDVTVVNVLDRASFDEGHISGSINIPAGEIETAASRLGNKDAFIVVHCASSACSASDTAGEKLRQMGYKNVRRFKGGIEEWKQSGFSLVGRTNEKAA